MEDNRQEVLDYVDSIKAVVGEDPQCFIMSLLLANRFSGTIYYDSNHFFTKIGETFYDKKSAVEDLPESYIEFNKEYSLENEMAAVGAIFHKQRSRYVSALKEHRETLVNELEMLKKDVAYLKKVGNIEEAMLRSSKLAINAKKVERIKNNLSDL